MLIALLAAVALADPAALAPGPPEMAAALSTLDERLAEANAIESATARIQNHLAEVLIGGTSDLCDSEAHQNLALRARLLGEAHRDAAQAATAAADRASAVLAAPTLAPLLDAADRQAFEARMAQVNRQRRVARELSAWHDRHLVHPLRACKPKLVTAPGLEPPRFEAQPPGQAVAVVVAAPGNACGVRGVVQGAVAVLPEGLGCWDVGECRCTPAPLLPGAALGPPVEAPLVVPPAPAPPSPPPAPTTPEPEPVLGPNGEG
jgi:hypothetical protein